MRWFSNATGERYPLKCGAVLVDVVQQPIKHHQSCLVCIFDGGFIFLDIDEGDEVVDYLPPVSFTQKTKTVLGFVSPLRTRGSLSLAVPSDESFSRSSSFFYPCLIP